MPRSLRAHASTAPLAPAALAALAACGASVGPGRGFEMDFNDNRPADVAGVVSSLASNVAEASAPALVVAVPPRPGRGMSVYALPEGRRLWRTDAAIDARPVVASGLVLSHAGREVIAWDARTGAEKWRIADRGYSLIGAGGDANALAISLGAGGLSRRRGTMLVVDPASGATRFSRDVEQALGVPTAGGGYAFVPWNGQHLTIIDVARRDEVARIRSTDDLFGRAVREGAGVYFGARALYRLAPESARGRREGALLATPPRDDLPGSPPMFPDGYEAPYAGVNARERVAQLFRPDPAQPGVRVVDGAVYVLFHRVVFALEADGGVPRWAHTGRADVAGAQPVRGGLAVADEQGTVALLDARAGNVAWRAALGEPIAQAVFALPIDFAPPRDGAEPAQPPADTLTLAAQSTDTRLLPARLFAARALGSMPGPDATRALLDIASRRNYPQDLRALAGEALARRTEGTDALVAALESHYDWVAQTSTPPVGYIARALAAARDRRGVAGLVAHLHDPDTPATELPPLVAALRQLGDPSAVPGLLDFLRLYHSDDGAVPPVSGGDAMNDRSLPDQEAMNAAMELAVQAVAELGGPQDRRWLQALYDDENTLEPVRLVLQRVLATPLGRDAAANSAGAGGGGQAPVVGGGNENAGGQPDQLPARLAQAAIDDAFAPVRDRMLACLSGATSRPGQLRVQFRYDAQGAIQNVAVTPSQWNACIAPIAQEVRLPRSRAAREIGSYYVIGGP